MTHLSNILAIELEKQLDKKFDVVQISKIAFNIYQNNSAELSPELDGILLSLMAMEEGPEFEMTESEIRGLIGELRSK